MADRSPESESDDASTRARLIEAAGQVFADEGFRNATVREICRRAGANVAAVNYHFGGKQALYNAALRLHMDEAARKYPLDASPDASPRERLTVFVTNLLRRIIEKGPDTWHGRLMMREMAEPTEYTDEHVERFVRPALATLNAIVSDWLDGGDAPPELRRRLVQSVVGQVMFFYHGRQVMARIHPDLPWDAAEAERAAAHIVAFSAAGIEAARRGRLS